MLQNINIKSQLLITPIIVILSFIGLYLLISSNLQKLDDKAFKASQANKMIKNMLEARIAEKNYTRRKNPVYVKELEVLLERNRDIATKLESSFTQEKNKDAATELKTLFSQYAQAFKKYQNLREQSLQSEKDMIREAREVEDAATAARAIQKLQRDELIKRDAPLSVIKIKMGKASLTNKIIKNLSDIRIAEKNYIRRKDPQYITRINQEIETIRTMTKTLKKDFKNSNNKKMMDSLMDSLSTYHNAFNNFASQREKSFILSSEMKEYAREAKKITLAMRATQKMQREEIKNAFRLKLSILFISIALTILAISLYIAFNVVKSLKNIESAAKDLTIGEGDLTKRINITGTNEIANVADNVNTFIKKVQAAISESKNVGVEASSIATELSATSLEIGKRVEDESALVQDVNSSAEETMKESEFVDGMVKQMHELSDKSFNELQDTTKQINNLISTVKESSIKEIELAEKMEDLRSSTNDIKSILELIGDIAEQTNLLSLNAAIEAARAGEHGRGFAVVADEVRKLAEGTQKSLVEINATINIVTQAVDDASDSMQTNAKEIANAAEKASSVEESIDSVISSIESTKTMAADSSQAVDTLKNSIGKISQKMQDLNDVSNSNARSVEEIAAAAEHQNSVIDKLSQQLASFKV